MFHHWPIFEAYDVKYRTISTRQWTLLGGFTPRKPSDVWTFIFSWFLLRTLWENCFRKFLEQISVIPTSLKMFMYSCIFLRFFLEMSLFEWNSKIRVTLDICNSVTIWRNSKKLYSWHFKILLLEMENLTFDGCFLIKWIFRNSLIILEWF